MVTIITIIFILVLIRVFGPFLLDILKGLFLFLELPFALFAGFFAFLLEALLFIGGLWLIVTIFGL